MDVRRKNTEPEETIDVLSRSLSIVQHRTGHRAASDDIFLAWAGIRARPAARRILDLGSGKGTVALLLLSRMPATRVVGVEAHPPHHALAVRNAALNGMDDRYDPRLGDLRDPAVLGAEDPFDLICGAPPYQPAGSGIVSKDPGRAAGRFELRGGVEDYAGTAARHLASGGRAVLLMHGQGRKRAEAALTEAGLSVCRVVAVRPRPGRAPNYWIVESAVDVREPVVEEELCMRRAEGMAWSPEYAAVRELLDLPPPGVDRGTVPPTWPKSGGF